MKVLVTAATKHGATAEIAATIGEVLRGEPGLDATVVPAEEVATVDGYDAVVLGSAVYAGHWLASAKELVDRAGGALAGKPVWLFSSGPIGDPPKPRTRSTSPRSWRRPRPASIGCSPASSTSGSSHLASGPSWWRCGSRKETSGTGPRSRAGRRRSPAACAPAPDPAGEDRSCTPAREDSFPVLRRRRDARTRSSA